MVVITKSDKSDSNNLAIRVSSDPILLKTIFARLKEPQYKIPDAIEEEIRKFKGVKSTDKGTLVSKVTTPEDYQAQIALMAAIQNCLDHAHEMNTVLYGIQHKYKELHNIALRHITLTYFNELNELKDGVRKIVTNVALQPIQEGLDKLEYLIELGESSYKHLTATNWNVKESTDVIREYLSLLKFPVNRSI